MTKSECRSLLRWHRPKASSIHQYRYKSSCSCLTVKPPRTLSTSSHFNFEPYNYGPFDKAVYQVLDELDEAELVTIRSGGWQRTYALTPTGQNEGDRLLGELSDSAKDYIRRVSAFVLKLNFLQLVSAIYKAYPDMQKNSILRSA